MPPLPTSIYLSADLELTFETFRCQWRRRRSQNNLKFTQREAFCVANFTLALTQFKLKTVIPRVQMPPFENAILVPLLRPC